MGITFEPFTEDEFEVSQEALEELGRLMQRTIQYQSNVLKIDAEGNSFPKGVDLFRSGRLMREVTFDLDTLAGVVTLIFTVPYAEDVAKRFNFLGIAPQLLPQFLEEASDIVARGLGTRTGNENIGGVSP